MVSWDRFWYGLRERSTQDCFRVKAYVHVNCSIDDDLRNRARGSVCELLASCVTRIHSTSASGASDMFSVKIRHQAQIDSAANSCWRFLLSAPSEVLTHLRKFGAPVPVAA